MKLNILRSWFGIVGADVRRLWGNVRLRESGSGLPHSKTLRDYAAVGSWRQLLECGSPLPLCGLLALSAINALGADTPERSAINSTTVPVVQKVQRAALSIQRKSWEQGVLAQAFLEQGDDAMVVAMAKASLIYQSKSGTVAAEGGAPVDPLMAGEAVWHAARITDDPDLKQAANRMLEYALTGAKRAADGTIYHTGEAMWSDSFHTTPPFLAYAGHYDEAIAQVEGLRKRLWNPDKKLMSHIWDEKKQEFTRKDCWGGGNGWAAAAITRVIRYLPESRNTDRQRLAGYLKDLLDGCLAHQRPDGLFYDVVDNPKSFPETNLTQMLAFSIFESVRGGWLSKDYLPAAQRMEAAARAKVDSEGFVHGVCGAPHFNAPGISAEGQAFYLLMECAAQKAATQKR